MPKAISRSSQGACKHQFTPEDYSIVRLDEVDTLANLRADLIARYRPVNSRELFAVEPVALAKHSLQRAPRERPPHRRIHRPFPQLRTLDIPGPIRTPLPPRPGRPRPPQSPKRTRERTHRPSRATAAAFAIRHNSAASDAIANCLAIGAIIFENSDGRPIAGRPAPIVRQTVE